MSTSVVVSRYERVDISSGRGLLGSGSSLLEPACRGESNGVRLEVVACL